MASAVGNGRDDAAVYVRAAHVHRESAARHEAAAAAWDARGNAEQAGFERRCASLERRLGRLEADRADLQRLRVRTLLHRRGPGTPEIERLSAEIARREAELGAQDDELERQRAVLRNERRTDDRRARQGAGYTSELIRRVARTFEGTATPAGQQADRQEEAGRPDAAARERSVAERARAAAELGRARAERLLSPRVDQAQNVPAIERSGPLDDTG